MTRATKPVWRVVDTSRGDICVAITPKGIQVRRPRARAVHTVSVEALEDLALKSYAASIGVPVPRPRQRRAGAR